MFSKTATAIAAAALAGKALAGDIIVVNNCPYDVYAFSVDFDQQFPAQITIEAGTTYREPTRSPSNNGGVSFKVNTISTPSGPTSPITQLEYTRDTVNTGDLFYNISFVDCATSPSTGAQNCPIWKDGISVVCAANNGCRQFRCPAGVECPDQVYYDPNATAAPEQPNTSIQGLNGSIRYTLCSGGSKSVARAFQA